MYKNARETDRAKERGRERERGETRGESFIVRKQYEGKSLIKNTKVVLFI